MVEDRTRASEAKCPFPGGKRGGSWGKEKESKKKKATYPAQWVGLKAMIRVLGVGRKAKAKAKKQVIVKERSPSSEVDELKGRNTSVKNVQVLKGYGVYGEIFQSRWILPFWSMSAISVVVYQETL